MKRIILLLLIAPFIFCANAQEQEAVLPAGDAVAKKIQPIYVGEADMESDAVDLEPNIITPIKEHGSDVSELDLIQLEKTKQKTDALGSKWGEAYRKTRANEPKLISGFAANAVGGSPPDNTVAMNSLGNIVSVVNSNIRFYKPDGISTYYKSIYSFLKLYLVPGQDTFISTICDPKVMFDCENKRFIIFAMTCDGLVANSKIMFAFSKTEDPSAGWNVYTFIADQHNKNVWFDHPRIGINQYDAFVSGNMFNGSNQYVEANIYQVDKMAAYAGNATVASYCYRGLSNAPFTPTFASHGACGNTGDKSYFIATSSGSTASTKLKFYTLSGKANGSTTPTIAFQSITVPSYSAPGYSPQPSSTILLRTGDCRGHDAYFLNNKIHFVFHTDAGGGYAGIYYAKLANSSGTWTAPQTKVIKNTTYDWTYPSIVPYGWTSTDETSLIGFLSSSSTEFPSMYALTIDPSLTLSNSVLLKSGLNFMGYIPTTTGNFTTCRWGDYSGMCLQPGASVPTAWFSGMFTNNANNWTPYIARLNKDWDIATSVTNAFSTQTDMQIYPTEASTFFNMEINVTSNTNASFILADANGKLIKKIYDGILPRGKNTFLINTSSLASGLYFVKAMDATNNTTQTQKLIIVK